MYAIIETGGKQFRVEEGSRILVDKLAAEADSEVSIDKVTARVLEHGRGEKILVFKKWRRNDSRKLQGHRQDYTAIQVTGIQA